MANGPLFNPFVSSRNLVPSPTPTPKPPRSILLLGYGGPDHDGGYLTDTIIEAVVDDTKKQVALISIPRDLAVPLPISDTFTQDRKINEAFAMGVDSKQFPSTPQKYRDQPGLLAKESISKVTGIPVDNYVAVSFGGFTKAIDTIGGVDVTFDRDFDDPHYPKKGSETDNCGKSQAEVDAITASRVDDITFANLMPCRYERVYYPAGSYHLNGTEALKVARSRKFIGSNGDFSRSQNQKMILLAVKDKVLSLEFLPKAVPFANSLRQDLITDIDLSIASRFLPVVLGYKDYKVKNIALTDQNVLGSGYNSIGQYILLPRTGKDNFTAVQEYIKSQL